MKFWEAMKALEEGNRVRCLSWKEDNILPPPSEKNEAGVCKVSIDWDGMIKTEWELYEEPVRLLSFMEVVKGLKEGKTYRRKEWPNPNYSIKHFDIGIMIASGSSAWYAYAQDFEATDWIEVK